jgi:hypothetical protein
MVKPQALHEDSNPPIIYPGETAKLLSRKITGNERGEVKQEVLGCIPSVSAGY